MCLSRLVRRTGFSRGLHTLVLSEHNNVKLSDATLAAVTAAMKIGPTVSVLVAGSACETVANQAAKIKGVSRVLVANHVAYQHFMAENVAALLELLQSKNKYTHFVTPASSVGKNIFPRAAVSFNSAPITDVISIHSPDTFVRPIYAGNAISTVQSTDAVKFITIRPTNFDKANVGDSLAPSEISPLPESPDLRVLFLVDVFYQRVNDFRQKSTQGFRNN